MSLLGDHFHLPPAQGAGDLAFKVNKIVAAQAASLVWNE